MTNIPEHVIDAAVDAIIAARDFCGNERKAAHDVARDHGITEIHLLDKVHRIANFRANARWNSFQKQAGVPPRFTW
jgi:hypothetical protein